MIVKPPASGLDQTVLSEFNNSASIHCPPNYTKMKKGLGFHLFFYILYTSPAQPKFLNSTRNGPEQSIYARVLFCTLADSPRSSSWLDVPYLFKQRNSNSWRCIPSQIIPSPHTIHDVASEPKTGTSPVGICLPNLLPREFYFVYSVVSPKLPNKSVTGLLNTFV